MAYRGQYSMTRCPHIHNRDNPLARVADMVGFDPFDVCLAWLRDLSRRTERRPISRTPLGSPCRFVRTIDFVVHRYLPEALVGRFPRLAARLANTSPRWGHVGLRVDVALAGAATRKGGPTEHLFGLFNE